jgi:hypothetical protein
VVKHVSQVEGMNRNEVCEFTEAMVTATQFQLGETRYEAR